MNFTVDLGKKEIVFKITELLPRAQGACFVKSGGTEVLSSCVFGDERKDLDFFPLEVDFEERYYAAGKIKGSRYVRREGRPSDEAICKARMIDRSLRPFFPKGFRSEVQVINTVLSFDEREDPDVLALLGSSLSLLISEIPWEGPVAAVRVGKVNGKLILNPSYEEREMSEFEVVFCGKKKGEEILINMVEGKFCETKEKDFLEALNFSLPFLEKLIEAQQEIGQKLGKPKMALKKFEVDVAAEREWESFLEKELAQIKLEKESEQEKKLRELREKFSAFLKENFPEFVFEGKLYLKQKLAKFLAQKAVKEGKRVDGRALDEIRPLECSVSLLERTHGSGLFCRGLTKVLSIVTLGGPRDVKLLEGMEVSGKKWFLHHYNFLPYCTGEPKTLKGPSRREIGHGMLVEKALMAVIPSFDEFPYTMRIVSEVLSSNGSTSMASVCASSLALMDAGVPIKRAVAGISLGLVSDGEEWRILTDIQGIEDQEGQMDFKIAGTKEGLCAIQLDVKNEGLSKEQIKVALEKGKKAREQILKVMEQVLPQPRPTLSPLAPKVLQIQIDPQKVREVIGPGGRVISEIIEECGVSIDIEENGKIFVTGEKEDAAKKAIAWIKNITRQIRVGEVFEGKIKRILPIGALVELVPGQEGLLPSREMRKLKRPFQIGKILQVKVISIDEFGRINLRLLK